MDKRGRFITIEGVDGAGKSEQTRRLAAALRAYGVSVKITREPGGSIGAEKIRDLLMEDAAKHWDATTEALLLYAARRDHWQRIEPELRQGTWVISDRFADSTFAYQGYGRGVSLKNLRQLHDLAVGVKPDLTLLLDLSPATGIARATPVTCYERMHLDFHNRVRNGFKRLAEDEPERFVVLDASFDIDDVAAAAFAAVCDRLAIADLVSRGGNHDIDQG